MTEVELKLEIAVADRVALLDSDLLGEPTQIINQYATYFDTKGHLLSESGFTLRIRRVGDVRTQSVKATGPSADLFARSEWETSIIGDVPVLDQSTPLLNEFGSSIRDLLGQFDVVIERYIWNVDENGTTIEVALDIGEVIAGERRTPVHEIELELKDGKASHLFAFARKIEALVPVKFGVVSKAERGYHLIEAARSMAKAEPIELDGQSSVAKTFQAIASSCFRQFRLNETILLSNRNPDALHQARVALRRLRSAIGLFRPLLQDGPAKRLSDEFRWLAGVLGETRNLDVLLAKADDDDLRQRLTDARAAAYEDVLEALRSSRARALMLDFNEWLRCGEYLSGSADGQKLSVVEFAIAALDKQRKKLKKHGQSLADIDDAHRHEARKDSKKLRYAAEFFRSVFDEKRGSRRYEKFIAAMEVLQDELGALNDLATGPEVLEKHSLRDHPCAGTLISHANKDKLIAKAQSAIDEVLHTRRFWS